MKYIFTIFLLLAQVSLAADQVPFAGEIKSSIRNYNRATSTLATSGTLGNGAVAELASKGITTMIDLRTKAEGVEAARRLAEANGMSYFNIQVTSDKITDEQLEVFTKIYESTKGATLLYCRSGNRVGGMLARYYISKGTPPDIAFSHGRAAGMRVSPRKFHKKANASKCYIRIITVRKN